MTAFADALDRYREAVEASNRHAFIDGIQGCPNCAALEQSEAEARRAVIAAKDAEVAEADVEHCAECPEHPQYDEAHPSDMSPDAVAEEAAIDAEHDQQALTD